MRTAVFGKGKGGGSEGEKAKKKRIKWGGGTKTLGEKRTIEHDRTWKKTKKKPLRGEKRS